MIGRAKSVRPRPGKDAAWHRRRDASSVEAMVPKRNITEEEIEDGLAVVARLIDCHGDAYWPIFGRLERELECRRSRRRDMAETIKQNHLFSLNPRAAMPR